MLHPFYQVKFKMARVHCSKCQKPDKACICAFFTPIDNDVEIVILRHVKETQHAKNTTPLLVNSLSNCQIIEGENFTENAVVNELIGTRWLADEHGLNNNDNCSGDESSTDKNSIQNFLLYPSDRARILDTDFVKKNFQIDRDINSRQKYRLFLIDATWKKAYRMYMLSKNLHCIPHLVLPEGIEGKYSLRKTKKENALSTLEAAVHALSILEQSPTKYEKLLENFVKFNLFQLSYTHNF